MRKLFILLALSVTLSCGNDDDGNSDTIDDYQLTTYAIGFINATDFDEDDVSWKFNSSTGKLTVVNNVSGEYPSMIASGTYDYSIIDNELSFMVDDRLYEASFDLSNDDMTLALFFENDPMIADDEEYYEFEKK